MKKLIAIVLSAACLLAADKGNFTTLESNNEIFCQACTGLGFIEGPPDIVAPGLVTAVSKPVKCLACDGTGKTGLKNIIDESIQLTNTGPEQVQLRIESNRIAQITVRTNFLTNWIALEMVAPNVPKKYFGVLQTNRVMWVIYAGRTNEIFLDNLWTEDVRIKQVAPAAPKAGMAR